MASTTYNDIVSRLDQLDPSELWLLLSDIQGRINSRPKRSLKDFEPVGKLNKNQGDWLEKMRSQWDDR